ncbi:LacI family DNA-binding transcriptional regulator [Kaistia terrae]|jgi:LacI family transcriptional regulator|uniref:LacI family DNA-binding transcriptional regulator n=1 Tax=Kaistia terrae TaxID=537017 RepID=A0ABW0Q021_9HYPH|nr:LacI family DNA-binding transcriptional regulator [Kaistia terrae]MCX5578832.1 LacI family DNA-binding transcriptional regulator [Kaistia terrae]
MEDNRGIPARKNATLKDVAEACGLSVAAVSRYLNHSIKLPQSTTDRIDAAIAALNYRPNPHARSLSLGRSETIGLVVPDIANPYFAHLAAAVEQAAAEYGLGLLLCPTLSRTDRELDYLGRLSRQHVDGLLFVTNNGDDPALARALLGAKTVVLVDDDIDGTTAPTIMADSEQGGRLATALLIEQGHRSLAYVGGPQGLSSSRSRLRGFRRAIAESGQTIAIAAELHGPYSSAHGRIAAEQLLALDPVPTALFAASDEIALGVLSVFKQRGVKVGVDISVIAFDDVGPLELFDPPLTAIRQPVNAMGRRAVQIVLALINGEALLPATELLPVELIIRNSVKPPNR